MQIIINLPIKKWMNFFLKKNSYKLLVRMRDIILEFLYSSINANWYILIYDLTDLSTYRKLDILFAFSDDTEWFTIV